MAHERMERFRQQALAFLRAGEHEHALVAARAALASADDDGAPDKDVSLVYETLARVQTILGDDEGALASARRVVALRERAAASGDVEAAALLNAGRILLAGHLEHAGEVVEAERVLTTAVAESTRSFGEEHPETRRVRQQREIVVKRLKLALEPQ